MYIVVDMGGTNTRLVTFASLDTTEFSVIDKFPTEAKYANQVERIIRVIQDSKDCQGIGFAIGAQLTRDGLSIDASYTMADYVGRPIVQAVRDETGLPVKSLNDNVCGVLAESYLGCLKPYERAAYLTVSTGTGAGIRLGSGSTSIAFLGQVGHHSINPNGEPCNCGQVGCVQTITGGQQFVRKYGKPAAEITDESVWREVTAALATAIVNLARITRVDAVCVSGGIGYNNPYIRAHIVDTVKTTGPGVAVEVMFPTFGEDAPIVGAALLLRDDMTTTLLH